MKTKVKRIFWSGSSTAEDIDLDFSNGKTVTIKRGCSVGSVIINLLDKLIVEDDGCGHEDDRLEVVMSNSYRRLFGRK